MPKKANVVYKFRRPSGSPQAQPSRAMSEALERLSESEELRHFAAKANAQNRSVVVEVFHSSEGHPILIHLGTVGNGV